MFQAYRSLAQTAAPSRKMWVLDSDCCAWAGRFRLCAVSLSVQVYLTMTVTLSDPLYYPTTFEYCKSNNQDGFMVTLKPTNGRWKVYLSILSAPQ